VFSKFFERVSNWYVEMMLFLGSVAVRSGSGEFGLHIYSMGFEKGFEVEAFVRKTE